MRDKSSLSSFSDDLILFKLEELSDDNLKFVAIQDTNKHLKSNTSNNFCKENVILFFIKFLHEINK